MKMSTELTEPIVLMDRLPMFGRKVMLPLERLNSIRTWCSFQLDIKKRWWRPWQNGYTAACGDILLLLEKDVAVMPINEYRALEGYYQEVYGKENS